MASYRTYKKDLSASMKTARIANGMDTCKTHLLMPGLIKRMFDFDLEVEILERDVFSSPERMPLVFNYMDLFFQIYPVTSDETFKKAVRLMKNLCRYYDKKSLS